MLREMPGVERFTQQHPDSLAWSGRAAAVRPRPCSTIVPRRGDLIALDGTVCRGPAEIARYYEHQLNGAYRDLRIEAPEFEETRFLAPDLAILNARWTVVGFRDADGSDRRPTPVRATFVITSRSTGWCFAATRFMVPFDTGLK